MTKLLPASVFALATVAAMATHTAAAQSPISLRSSIFAGPAFPTGDNKNALNTGFTGGAAVDVGAPLLPLGLRADASYTYFGLQSGSGFSGNSSDVSGRINAVLGIPMLIVSPYVIGGLGMYHLMSSASYGGLGGSGSTNKTGWNIGAGIDLPLLVFSARIEARYHNVSTSGGSYTYLPVTVGIRF